MNVICFGDSNTYGYDPRSYLGSRYDKKSRWVDLLAAKTGWAICNMGENGRTIPLSPPVIPNDTDLLIVMLGTNNLLQGQTPEDSAQKLEHVLIHVPLCPNQILLIAPPPLSLGQWVTSQQLVDRSLAFAQCCQELAQRLRILFADAGTWKIPLTYDGVHFTEQGHKQFACGLLDALNHMKIGI